MKARLQSLEHVRTSPGVPVDPTRRLRGESEARLPQTTGHTASVRARLSHRAEQLRSAVRARACLPGPKDHVTLMVCEGPVSRPGFCAYGRRRNHRACPRCVGRLAYTAEACFPPVTPKGRRRLPLRGTVRTFRTRAASSACVGRTLLIPPPRCLPPRTDRQPHLRRCGVSQLSGLMRPIRRASFAPAWPLSICAVWKVGR